MEFYISFSIINLILDFSILLMVNFYAKLYVKKVEMVITLIFSLFPSIMLICYHISFFLFVIIKVLDYFVLTLLITDEYKLSRLFQLNSILVFSMFSVYGFMEFFIEFVKTLFLVEFNIKIGVFYHFLIVFAVFLYIFALVMFFGKLSKKKNIQNFLYTVSFFLFGKHIEITGLLDSGNSLYDTKTGKAVMIVSLYSLKKYLSEDDYENLLFDRSISLGASSYATCVTVGGNNVQVPIFDIGEVKIEQTDGSTKICKCVLGITKEKFAENDEYDCLLHREFI